MLILLMVWMSLSIAPNLHINQNQGRAIPEGPRIDMNNRLARCHSMPNLHKNLPTLGRQNQLSSHRFDSESIHDMRIRISRLEILKILSDIIYSIHTRIGNLNAHRFAELINKELPENIKKQINSIIIINNPNLAKSIENIQKNLFRDESVVVIDQTSCMVRFCTRNDVTRIGRRFLAGESI